ncbi:MAG: oligoribonuclease, partial [Myxococcales bacterium]|nr:oligoribonuclease [Myxococcales bacterium]
MAKADRLVWMDLEMTGLDPWHCAIVEIATLVTDGDLTIVAEGPNLVVHQPDEVLAQMDDFVREMHTRSGLLDRIRASEVSLEDAETMTLAFLKAHVAERSAPLCGNSIWKDRQFVERYLPRVDAHLHYRNIDVSSFKEVLKRWYPGRYAPPEKKETHRALDDIRESIAEL